jgi:alpha-tubulin suppressor-like RCC1 family protein
LQLDAKQIVETSGFCCAPSVIFSEKDQDSCIYIDKRQSILTKLLTPTILKSLISNNVTMISCGFEHCLLLNKEGLVMSWGCGASGSLGHGDYISYTEPKIIESLKHQTNIQSGGYHNSSIVNFMLFCLQFFPFTKFRKDNLFYFLFSILDAYDI